MRKKIITLTEPRAENSARACSDCLALTELTRLGVQKCLQGWLGQEGEPSSPAATPRFLA